MRDVPWKLAIIAAIVGVLVILTVSYCSDKRRIENLQDEATLGDARTQSAQDAVAALGDVAEANAATETETKEAQDAVRQADPADRDRVFRQQLCILQGGTAC